MADLDDVARITADLPESEEFERHGLRAWWVRGKVFAWEREFSKADVKRFGGEPLPAYPIVAVRVADQNDKEAALSAGTPGIFTIPHFNGFNAVLIQLDSVSDEALVAALTDAWLAMAPPSLAGDPG